MKRHLLGLIIFLCALVSSLATMIAIEVGSDIFKEDEPTHCRH